MSRPSKLTSLFLSQCHNVFDVILTNDTENITCWDDRILDFARMNLS